MKKKIAFVLIMVLLANMVAWADDTSETDPEVAGIIVAGFLVALGIGLVIALVKLMVAEADAPDDGIRLASFQDAQSLSETNPIPALNLLQHVEVGQTQNDKMYVGLHFKF